MIITYSRSSGLKNWEMCNQSYFIQYNLGVNQTTGKKALLGTISHKVLEWVALAKLHHNEDKIKFYDDSLNCDIEIDPKEFYKKTVLPSSTIKEINKTRSNKQIYKTAAMLEEGTSRIGYEVINDLIIKSFQYYTSKYSHEWLTTDLKNCGNWVWMALEWNGGHYDPRNMKIVSPEQAFDITIDLPWANYEFDVGGEKTAGKFAIKGTIDLVVEASPDTLEVCDYKTGQRYDWSKGEEKTYAHMHNDIQLMLYHYAVTKLYPQYKNVLITIFYIRDGGPYTITLDSSNLGNVEEKLRQHFEEVKATKLPKMLHNEQKDFRCTKLCSYYKNNWPGTNQNICRFIHNETKRIGMDNVIEKYKQQGHEFEKYCSPGA